MTEHKIDGALTLLLLASTLTGRQEMVIWAWCGFGGVLSGYMGALWWPVKGLKFRDEWIVNVIISVVVAPFATWYLMDKFPDCPLPFLSMIVSGALGALGVLVIPYLLKKNGIKPPSRKDE